MVAGRSTEKLLERLLRFRDERNWKQFHTPKDLALSVSVEAAELLEVFQWRKDEAPVTREIRSMASGEAADVLIYLLLLSDSVGFDLLQAAEEKIAQNERRFPVSETFGIAKPDGDRD